MSNSKWLIDVESRGKLAFNSGFCKNHATAEAYSRKSYHTELERNVFIAGWNMAKWGQ